MQLYLSEEVTSSSEITPYGVAAYCGLRIIMKKDLSEYHVNIDQMAFYLSGSSSPSRKFVKSIKHGLEELIDQDIVNAIYRSDKRYILNLGKITVDTEQDKFTIINHDEIKKILNINSRNKFLILKYFIFLIGTLHGNITVYLNVVDSKNRVVGNLPMSFISNKSGISQRSIIEYNKLLEQNGLLYINRSNDFILDQKENNLKSLANVYGRSEDKLYIDEFATNVKKYKGSYNYVTGKKEKSNNNRSKAQKYNGLVNGREYSHEEILQIYHYVKSENKKYQSLYEKDGQDSHIEKIRDTDIFNKYLSEEELS